MIRINKFSSAEHRPIITLLEMSLHRKLHGPILPKVGKGLIFPETPSSLYQKPDDGFQSSRYQSTLSLLGETNGNVIFCACFLAAQI